MVVALRDVLLPLTPTHKVSRLPVLDVVVAGVLTEHVSPVVAGQVPVTDGGHQVPDGSPALNKLFYLGPEQPE